MDEEEDVEVWPGATDEIQRLELLEEQTRENEGVPLFKLAY
jgi:hypothetical protein